MSNGSSRDLRGGQNPARLFRRYAAARRTCSTRSREPAAVVEPLFAEYEQVLDRLARELHDRGEIASTYAEAWARLWRGVRDRLAAHPPTKPAHRWRGTEPVCA